jgi:hypothetical protein
MEATTLLKPSSRLKRSERAQYLEFIMSEQIQLDLRKIPTKEQLNYLQEQFKTQTNIFVSRKTQSRIKQAINSGKLIEIKGKYFIA